MENQPLEQDGTNSMNNIEITNYLILQYCYTEFPFYCTESISNLTGSDDAWKFFRKCVFKNSELC